MPFNMGGAAMTIVAVDQVPATSAVSDRKSFPDEVEYLTGFVETARLLGLRLAGYEAWAAGICALVAVGCLVGVTWLAITFIAPALVAPALDTHALHALVPTGCGSSIDCALRTIPTR
jgi:hypothetical protein